MIHQAHYLEVLLVILLMVQQLVMLTLHILLQIVIHKQNVLIFLMILRQQHRKDNYLEEDIKLIVSSREINLSVIMLEDLMQKIRILIQVLQIDLIILMIRQLHWLEVLQQLPRITRPLVLMLVLDIGLVDKILQQQDVVLPQTDLIFQMILQICYTKVPLQSVHHHLIIVVEVLMVVLEMDLLDFLVVGVPLREEQQYWIMLMILVPPEVH